MCDDYISVVYGINVPIADSAKFLKKYPNIREEGFNQEFKEDDPDSKNLFLMLREKHADDKWEKKEDEQEFNNLYFQINTSDTYDSIFVGICNHQVNIDEFWPDFPEIMENFNEIITEEYKQNIEKIIDETLHDHKEYKRCIHLVPTIWC